MQPQDNINTNHKAVGINIDTGLLQPKHLKPVVDLLLHTLKFSYFQQFFQSFHLSCCTYSEDTCKPVIGIYMWLMSVKWEIVRSWNLKVNVLGYKINWRICWIKMRAQSNCKHLSGDGLRAQLGCKHLSGDGLTDFCPAHAHFYDWILKWHARLITTMFKSF